MSRDARDAQVPSEEAKAAPAKTRRWRASRRGTVMRATCLSQQQ